MNKKLFASCFCIVLCFLFMFTSCSDNGDGNKIKDNVNVENNTGVYTVEMIENAIRLSILEGDISYIQKYVHPDVYELLKYAYEQGEENSILADCHVGIDGLYTDIDYNLNEVIDVDFSEYDGDSESDAIITNEVRSYLGKIGSSIVLKNVYYDDCYLYFTGGYHNTVTAFIIETNSGAYLLGYDY